MKAAVHGDSHLLIDTLPDHSKKTTPAISSRFPLLRYRSLAEPVGEETALPRYRTPVVIERTRGTMEAKEVRDAQCLTTCALQSRLRRP